MLRSVRKGYKMAMSVFLGGDVDCMSLYCVFDTLAIVLVLQLWDRQLFAGLSPSCGSNYHLRTVLLILHPSRLSSCYYSSHRETSPYSPLLTIEVNKQ